MGIGSGSSRDLSCLQSLGVTFSAPFTWASSVSGLAVWKLFLRSSCMRINFVIFNSIIYANDTLSLFYTFITSVFEHRYPDIALRKRIFSVSYLPCVQPSDPYRCVAIATSVSS
jgi:hypothetical protein